MAHNKPAKTQPPSKKQRRIQYQQGNPFQSFLDKARLDFHRGRADNLGLQQAYVGILKNWIQWNRDNVTAEEDNAGRQLEPSSEGPPLTGTQGGRTLSKTFRLTSYGDVTVVTPLDLFCSDIDMFSDFVAPICCVHGIVFF
jgi:hypothetical protein